MHVPTFRRMIEDQGYPLEKHVYTTEDGYINTVFRIPGKKGTKPTIGQHPENKEPKPVVIYQHGLVDSCHGIVCAGTNSIGLQLVDAGYDLWLNNSRGSRWSRDHQTLDVNFYSDPSGFSEYFEFSWSEMAQFDQPALWNYVLKTTGAEKITYIGHS